jgi:alpha-galactosidase
MPGAVADLARPGAGRVAPTALGLRSGEPTRASATRAAAQAPFRSGASRFGELELDVFWQPDADVARARVRVRNTGARPRALEAVVLELAWSGAALPVVRYLKQGWQSWSYTGSRLLDAQGDPPFLSGPWLRGLHHAAGELPPERAGWHESHLVLALGGVPGPACCVGVEERGRSFATLYAKREDGAIRIAVEWRVDAELPPGAALELEPLHVALGDDAGELLEAFADGYGRSAGARVWRPFVAGWCSWYYAFHDVREDDVLRNLDALAAAQGEIPVDVVQLDDGFQRAVGDWLATNAKFPRGLAPLAEAIRSAGFAAGLWTAPFCGVRESELFAKHPDWWLRQPDGSGELLRGLLHPAWSADASVYVLDAARPDVLAHLEETFTALAGMGFQYLKLDFLYAEALASASADPTLARAARLRRGLEAIRRGAGEESFLLGCGCPLGAAVGVVDGMRIGPDVAPHWLPEDALRIPEIAETLPSTRSALRSSLARAWMHRRLWSNDPDCLLVRGSDTQLTADERSALAAVIATTGGVAVFSDDLTRLGAGERALLAGALRCARAVDTAGLPGVVRVPELLRDEIPGRALANDGADPILALLNPGDAASSLRVGAVDASDAHAIESGIGGAALRGAELELPPHAGSLLRVRRRHRFAVFCDFDGTFSVQDVGATLAARHGGSRRPAVWARYERGEIRAWDYNLEILDGLALPESELETFLRSEVALDPGARDLLDWCAERDVPFRVLSDGFDWNLNRLQALHGVSFAYTANHMRYERGRWRIRAGWPDPSCGCGTGTCKGGFIRAFRAAHPGAFLVHVGNGRVSDMCGALAADAAFAKDSLAQELTRRGIAFRPFETLHDVIPGLAALWREHDSGAPLR